VVGQTNQFPKLAPPQERSRIYELSQLRSGFHDHPAHAVINNGVARYEHEDEPFKSR
jgi:hypothetical protein